jgi:RNA polymerase sigma-70 factor (ECF subfamily)
LLPLDDRVAGLLARGAHDEATTLILEELGPEMFRFLAARLRDIALATDAFSRFSENVWRGVPNFSAKSSVRVWAYAVARNAAGQELRGNKRHRENRSDFSESMASQVAERIRTETVAWHRTAVKDRFAALQEELDQEERELLFLRVNQKLGWDEIAKVQAGDDAGTTELKREAARLRKRFQLTRAKLRKLASEKGLLGDGEEGPSSDG